MSSASINEIIRLCNSNQIQKVISLTPTVLHNFGPNAFATLLHFCARNHLLTFGQSLHRQLPPMPLPAFLSNHLVNMYSKCSRPDLARHVFDEMPIKNLVSWTTLLTGFNQNGLHDDCFRVFVEMIRSNCVPNDFGFVGVLSSCSKRSFSCGGRQGRQVHGVVCKIGFADDVYVGNGLISMYCRCYDDGDEQGWLLFRTMKWQNSISWNSMINGFSMNGRFGHSIKLFACMLRNKIDMDRATILGVLPSCSSLKSCWQLHGFAIKTNFVSEVEVATAFVKAYSASSGDIRDCYRVFSDARDHDTMSWTGIITSFADRDPEKAILLFHRFRSEGFVPDRHTFSIAVKACSTMTTERYGSALHSLILKSGFENDMVVSNALIHAYSRCGNINLAESIFRRCSDPGLVTWNSMIKAYAMHGRGEESLKLFSTMKTAPDSTTFVAVLSACSHKGLISEAREIFKSMKDIHKISPDTTHYACMVDVLSRVGLLREAKELIDEMTTEPDSVIWSTLLGACRKHGEVVLGEYAGQKLMEIQPENSAGYVMMSNLYREGGSLDSAAFVRKDMKEYGVKKTPGLSWIEIGNHVHEFASGGRRHSRIEEVSAVLKVFVGKLKKEKGYVTATAAAATEEDEERVLMHGEKLAFVFGMMNRRSGENCIRIMKNIRTCVDCHCFMKLASKLTGLEIVLRDTNRFHHFRDEVCSCGDYW
ncbi:Pentatricopeptide repeat-containing protein [Zostera marina]|uniref:Pentatricopeptide repeat-containing protein n=1 Tax=Zostera marina TaxID=29655 RepID=A0A0K9NUM5_ZOSMR|nr:Pentatricopeptide repeat-containing protein [Zostera marina]